MVEITGDYEGELHCRAVHGPSGTAINTDAPKDNQGRGEAFSPTDLVATALATCMATTMAIAARRHKVELTGMRYRATKEMSTEPPRRISRIAVDIWLPPAAKALPPGLLEAAANQCPVHRSLDPSVEKTVQFHWV
jgi:uncharacterized OsmC-like protein